MKGKRMQGTDKNFIDWEGDTFGYGYGTGEAHILPALKKFFTEFSLKGESQMYDYRDVENHLGPVVAWVLINALCRVDIIEYGTSPRFGWLTTEGKSLKYFIDQKTATELVDLCTEADEDHSRCYHDACNCGPNGYQKSVQCQNPFWHTVK